MATDHDMQHAHSNSNADVSYERQDMGARNIMLFFAILLIAGVIVHFIIWGVYGAMEKVVARMDPVPSPVKAYEETPRAELLQNTPMVNLDKFAQPRLQSDDVTDMRAFLWQEKQILYGHTWQDQSGAVHIPINEAMQQILKKGLPTRAPGETGQSVPYTANLGGTSANEERGITDAQANKQ